MDYGISLLSLVPDRQKTYIAELDFLVCQR